MHYARAMTRPWPPSSDPGANPLRVALTGMLSLAVAMGIGRFAFTPLLPMMLHDGVINLPSASALATANYLGYWIGAIACALQPWLWTRALHWPPIVMTRAIRTGLAGTVLLTAGMALHWPDAWAWLRFAAGLASALVFVYTSNWCLGRLTALGAPRLGGVIYVGPGLGITLSGLAATAMVAGGLRAAHGWALFAGVALLLTAIVWRALRTPATAPAPASTAAPAPHGRHPRAGGQMAALVFAYGTAGFGYIVTATFLPVIARQALPGSIWLDLFWPLFGVAVAAGSLLTLWVPMRWDRRHLLVGCYALQGAGVMLGVWWPSLAGFALGSLLLGLPFTAITLFGLQEARRLSPERSAVLISLMTAAYGLGQIAGPAMVSVLLAKSASPELGLVRSLEIAAASLVLGLAVFVLMAWLRPQRTANARGAR